MKRIILSFFLLAFLQSCEKDSTDSGSISFTLNNKEYNFKNSSDGKQAVEYYKLLRGQGFSDTTRYIIGGRDEVKDNLVYLSFKTDILKTENYILDYNSGGTVLQSIRADSISYVVFPGDQISFNVTSLENNRISGTFSGQLSTINNTGKVDVTNGKVDNIRFQE